ncbi:MAG: hypothetical protein ACRDGM_04730 [bacterium]
MKAGLMLIVLLLTGCSSMTPGQRIALYCNPVSHAADLALFGLMLGLIVGYQPSFHGGSGSFGGSGSYVGSGSTSGTNPFPGAHCVEAIKDKVRQAENEKGELVDCPSLDAATQALLERCDVTPESEAVAEVRLPEARPTGRSIEPED